MSKVLSIKQPWASLICTPRQDNILLGIKDIENRTWKTKFRGRIHIHASGQTANFTDLFNKKYPHKTKGNLFIHSSSLRTNHEEFKKYPHSAIIGEVDIIDCVINHSSIWAEKFTETDSCPECGCEEFLNENLVAEGYRMCKECHQDWYVDVNYGKTIYNWVLANPVLYDTPILNVKGKLSFWEYLITKP